MSGQTRQDIEEHDILDEMQDEIQEIEQEGGEEGEIDEEKIENFQSGGNTELEKCKDLLARTQADFDNFKKRTARDRDEMIFFLKSDILKKVLPRMDDLERMLQNTPEDMREGVLFEGISSLHKNFAKDLDKLGVVAFVSLGEAVDPDKHDVMTQAPGEEGIIIDEFEKGYMLEGKILRHAKVVAGNGSA